MRHLRKNVQASRGVRQGILGCAALALVAALTAALTACGTGGKTPGASWFQLRASVFQPISGPEAAAAVPALPWTVQSRVTDFAFLGNTLYCAVNGAGIAIIDFDTNGAPEFNYRYDSPIFAHRTITTLLPRHGDLAVHLYYNALLNDVKPDALLLRGICLVTFLPGQKEFGFLIPPFQRSNPAWEAVGFAPITEDEFIFEWKYTDSSETKFLYTRYRSDLQVEATSTRDEYIAALGAPSLSGNGVPGSLAAFFQACRARLTGLSPQTAVHFKVRSRETPTTRSYRSDPLADSIVVIPVFEEKGDAWALLPDGTLLMQPSSGEAKTAALPRLPKGCRYTDIVKAGGLFVVPWERAKFTEVGEAGALFVKSPF